MSEAQTVSVLQGKSFKFDPLEIYSIIILQPIFIETLCDKFCFDKPV